jgi:hypothetical protein
MEFKEILFSGHATRRMFERGITTSDVRAVIESGETIADYPDDHPYPSKLMLGIVGKRTFHAVVAVDEDNSRCYVVTAYFPEPGGWDAEFRTRKAP